MPEMPVKLAPHYQHFSNFMRVLTSFAIFLELLTGFRNRSVLLIHKTCNFRNSELISHILEIVTVNYGKYGYSKFQQFFSKSYFREFQEFCIQLK